MARTEACHSTFRSLAAVSGNGTHSGISHGVGCGVWRVLLTRLYSGVTTILKGSAVSGMVEEEERE